MNAACMLHSWQLTSSVTNYTTRRTVRKFSVYGMVYDVKVIAAPKQQGMQ
jgi:hypothetical protein